MSPVIEERIKKLEHSIRTFITLCAPSVIQEENVLRDKLSAWIAGSGYACYKEFRATIPGSKEIVYFDIVAEISVINQGSIYIPIELKYGRTEDPQVIKNSLQESVSELKMACNSFNDVEAGFLFLFVSSKSHMVIEGNMSSEEIIAKNLSWLSINIDEGCIIAQV